VVRLPADRANVQSISDLLVSTPGGAAVRLADVADIKVVDGPAQISREMGKRRIVGMNVKGRDLGGFVAELQKKVDQVKLPAAITSNGAASSRTCSARWAI
jgi:cobalt-zinc-cadmium resistance protein CzcA